MSVVYSPKLFLTATSHLFLSPAGCLLDFLKTDEGKKLKVNKLIDMAAQVRPSGLGENPEEFYSRFQCRREKKQFDAAPVC